MDANAPAPGAGDEVTGPPVEDGATPGTPTDLEASQEVMSLLSELEITQDGRQRRPQLM